MKTQRPTTEDNWLYRDVTAEERWFTKEAVLSNNAPDLPECTNEEKEEWEHEHHPEPEQPEEQNDSAEPVNEESNE